MSIKIIEVKSAAEVFSSLNKLSKNSTIYLDVDETLIIPISSSFQNPTKLNPIDLIKQRKAEYNNYRQILSAWRMQRQVQLIDAAWPQVIAQLQQNHQIYGLTKMDIGQFGFIKSIEQWRIQELKSLGINFIDNPSVATFKPEIAVSYHLGVFFTGEYKKSDVLKAYSPLMKPNLVVLVDDKMENITDLADYCQQLGIEFLGLHFKGLNQQQLAGYNQQLADFQQEYLVQHLKWLEDDAARKLLQ